MRLRDVRSARHELREELLHRLVHRQGNAFLFGAAFAEMDLLLHTVLDRELVDDGRVIAVVAFHGLPPSYSADRPQTMQHVATCLPTPRQAGWPLRARPDRGRLFEDRPGALEGLHGAGVRGRDAGSG